VRRRKPRCHTMPRQHHTSHHQRKTYAATHR
jgi:hypothetical protein